MYSDATDTFLSPRGRRKMAEVFHFKRSDTLKYNEWLDSPENKNGFVLNMGGFKIHNVWCHSLQRDRLTDPYEKACCLEIRPLEEWLQDREGSEAGRCGHCTAK